MADLGPQRPGGDRLHLGHDRRAARRRLPAALPRRPGVQAKHWFGAGDGEIAWCTAAPGWSKSTRNAFIAPWIPGRRRRPPRRPLRPRRAAAPLRGARRQRPLPGADRVPDAGQARRARPRPQPAPPGLGRRADRAGDDPPLPGAARPRRSPTATARPRPARSAASAPTRTTPRATARWAGRCPASRPGSSTASCSCAPPPPPPSSTTTSTASRFEGEWWPTGDRVREDEAGYLWFEGRNDDLILSSGYRIGPFEVESALVSHPAVAEAAAVAAPDPERGSVVRAIVVLQRRQRRPRTSSPPSCRSTSRPRPPPTSTRASSSSPRSCRRRPAARSSGPSCAAQLGWRRGGDRPQADRRADRGPAGAVPQPHRALGRDLRARRQVDAGRRPLLLPGERPLAGLHRPRRGQPGLGRRRQRIRRLPQRLRRDVHRPRQPDGRRRGQGPDRPRHPLRRPHRRLDRRLRGAASAASACPSGASTTPAPRRRWTPSTSPAAPPAATRSSRSRAPTTATTTR